MNTRLRPLCLSLAVLASIGLSACGSSGNTGASRQAPIAAARTPRPSPAALTKAQFVAKMESVCADFDARLNRLPHPKSEQDFAGIAAVAQATVALFPQYLKQADALVGQAADKATLTRKWMSYEKADFAAAEPILTRFIADLKTGNRFSIAVDARALDKLPDHSESIAGFMNGYGLKGCAKLENS